MGKNKKYYGILLNDEIPKINKINKYNKEVKISFEGKAYLLEKNDNNEIERIEIENNYKLTKERDYKIEFINLENEIYIIEVRLKSSYFFLLLLLFVFGFVIGLSLCKPELMENTSLSKFVDYINFSIIPLNIIEDEELKYYEFDVLFENISADINLSNTISAKSLVKNKIAPGVEGNFGIIVSAKNSSVDMKYNIEFEDLNNEKPTNMTFGIKGYDKQYSSLQELQSDLDGVIERNSKRIIVIEWKWNYENGNTSNSVVENDEIDTNEAKELNNYRFKILVTGQEVV